MRIIAGILAFMAIFMIALIILLMELLKNRKKKQMIYLLVTNQSEVRSLNNVFFQYTIASCHFKFAFYPGFAYFF